MSKSQSERCALWLRVSTDQQTTENQRRLLLQFAEHRGYEVVSEFDISGVSAWQNATGRFVGRIIKESVEKRFNILLIYALDRLSRRGPADTVMMLRRLQEANIAVVSYNEPLIDTTGPTGELVAAIFGYLARLESDRRSERTKAGMERAREQGVHIGRPKGSKDKRRRTRRR